MSREIDERKKRKALRRLRKAAELAARGEGPELSDWERTFLEEVEERIESLPRQHPGLTLASSTFLRTRAEQRPRNTRAVLIEYRFRILEA